MNDELIKKAYEHFNGVWPYLDHLSMVVKIGAKRSDGERYGSYGFNKEFFDCNSFLISEWQWVGTKSDFDAYAESLEKETRVDWSNSPEGSMYAKVDKNDTIFFKNSGVEINGQEMASMYIRRSWALSSWSVNYVKNNLEVRPFEQETEWMPDPDSMCEIKHDNEILSWKKAKYIGVNTVGSKKYAVVFFPYISEYKNYKLDDSLKFRPIKTEAEKQADAMFDIVKDATDVYHACELLVKEGFKQCAG